MSKEADKYLKENISPLGYSRIVNEGYLETITIAMQSYAKEQVDKALKEKGKELLNFQEEIISNPIRFNGVNHKVIERLMNIEPEF